MLLCRPINDVQSGNSRKITVFRHNRAVAEIDCDGSNLDIDLLHRATHTAQLGEQKTENLSGRYFVRPNCQIDKLSFQQLFIPDSSCTEMDACPQLTKYRSSDADSIPIRNSLSRSLIHSPTSVDVITCDASIQQESRQNSSSVCDQLSRMSSFCICRFLRWFVAARVSSP